MMVEMYDSRGWPKTGSDQVSGSERIASATTVDTRVSDEWEERIGEGDVRFRRKVETFGRACSKTRPTAVNRHLRPPVSVLNHGEVIWTHELSSGTTCGDMSDGCISFSRIILTLSTRYPPSTSSYVTAPEVGFTVDAAGADEAFVTTRTGGALTAGVGSDDSATIIESPLLIPRDARVESRDVSSGKRAGGKPNLTGGTRTASSVVRSHHDGGVDVRS